MTEIENSLETKHLGKLMAKYCVPCIIALLVATLYNIVDQLFIANAPYLGSYGTAACSVIFPLTVVALGVAMLVGDGCCALVSNCLGAKDSEKASRAIGSSIISLVVLGIALMVIYLALSEQIITLFGGRVNATTFEMAKEYFFWIALGIPFYMFGQAMNPIVRADGSPGFAMAALVLGAVTNIILDYVFIYITGWGMAGAAIATILGQILSALLFVGYLFHMRTVKLRRDSFRFRFSLMKQIAPLGAASLLTQISIVLSIAVVLNMANKYGALDPIYSQEQYAHIPASVIGIVIKFYQVMISVSIGFATGCIPIAAYNMGAKRFDRAWTLLKLLLITQAVVGLIASILFLVFPAQLTNLFGGKNESIYYVQYSIHSIRIFMCASILSCVNKAVSIYQQALGNAKTATFLCIMREIVFGVSMPVILPAFLGLNGILYFMPVSDVITFIVSMVVVVRTNKQLRRMQQEALPAQQY